MNRRNQALSQDYHQLDPVFQAFQHNRYVSHFLHNDRGTYSWMYCTWYQQPQDILVNEALLQEWNTGSYSLSSPTWTAADEGSIPNPTVCMPGAIVLPVADFCSSVAAGRLADPRIKYKVRRTYWTGIPRHRRNLPVEPPAL